MITWIIDSEIRVKRKRQRDKCLVVENSFGIWELIKKLGEWCETLFKLVAFSLELEFEFALQKLIAVYLSKYYNWLTCFKMER